MASERLTEEDQIFELIKNGHNFLLSGGAGSGKTYSLVEVIKKILSEYPKAKIACITYTNTAVHEIEKRFSYKNMRVSTIHDFLWNSISSFQKEMKETLLEEINKAESDFKNIYVEKPYSNIFPDGIMYKEYLSIDKGYISHDEVIVLANKMFKKYEKLCNIVNWKYDYILVDEYQDTFSAVIEILLDSLNKGKRKSIIGFFGDSMQAIYKNGGEQSVTKYVDEGKVKEVKKEQNRRNPQLVIELSNKLRTDGLKQVPSTDINAPNMLNGKVKQGSIKFIYGEIDSIDNLKSTRFFDGWNFSNSEETKELRLTNNLIANAVGFPSLMEIYDKDPIMKLKTDFIKHIKENSIPIDESLTFEQLLNSTDWKYSGKTKDIEKRNQRVITVFLSDTANCELFNMVKNVTFSEIKKMHFDKDCLIADKKETDERSSTLSKRDKLIRHLFKIQNIIFLYENKQYNDFIRKTSFKVKSVADKKAIKEKVEQLINMKNNTIQEVIEYANDSGLCVKDDIINEFIKSNSYLYKRVSKVTYNEFVNLYAYLENHTPFSTQHKVNGDQYKNVLIILDNGKWSDYNFEYLFDQSNPKCNQNVLMRTQKLFYVCCTRTMENLVVYCSKPSERMIHTAEEWFGQDNCFYISTSLLNYI